MRIECKRSKAYMPHVTFSFGFFKIYFSLYQLEILQEIHHWSYSLLVCYALIRSFVVFLFVCVCSRPCCTLLVFSAITFRFLFVSVTPVLTCSVTIFLHPLAQAKHSRPFCNDTFRECQYCWFVEKLLLCTKTDLHADRIRKSLRL